MLRLLFLFILVFFRDYSFAQTRPDKRNLEAQQTKRDTVIINRKIEIIESLPLRRLKYKQIIFVIEDREYTERELPELPELKFDECLN